MNTSLKTGLWAFGGTLIGNVITLLVFKQQSARFFTPEWWDNWTAIYRVWFIFILTGVVPAQCSQKRALLKTQKRDIDMPVKTALLPKLAVATTSLGVIISTLLSVAVAAGIVEVAWNAKRIPQATLGGLVPFCVVGLLISCGSWFQHRDKQSLIAIVLGLLAVTASLGAFLLIVMTSIAGHPA